MIYKVKTDKSLLTAITKKIVRPKTFDCPEFFTSYKKWVVTKTRVHTLADRLEIYNVVKTLFKNVSEALRENEGGVVMEGIGYLGFFLPIKKVYKPDIISKTKQYIPLYQTNYYKYEPYLFTDVFNDNKLEGWSMEHYFKREIKEDFEERRKPKKLYYNEIKSIYREHESDILNPQPEE